MNVFVGIGNLTREPECETDDNGIDTAKFTIAIDRWRDSNGNKQTDFIRCIGKKTTAKLIQQYLHKGSKVAINGSLRTYRFSKENGEQVNGFYIAVNEVTFLPRSDPDNVNHGDVHSDIYGPAHYDTEEGTQTDPSEMTPVDDINFELPF